MWEPFWWPVGGSCEKKDSATYVQKVRRCMHQLYEIPLASEESRTSAEAVLLEKNDTEIEALRCCCVCLDVLNSCCFF